MTLVESVKETVKDVKSAVVGTQRNLPTPLPPPNSNTASQLYEYIRLELTMSYRGTLVTNQEMADARLPLAYRDKCAHLLVPLNRCRYDSYYLPWKCEVYIHPTCIFPYRGTIENFSTTDAR